MKHVYQGEIVRAAIVEREINSLKGRILTGHAEGHVVPIVYRGRRTIADQILVRMEDHPQKELNNRPLEEGFFVTSEIPDGFEMARSEDVLFYGIWERQMRNAFRIPNTGRIINYFNLGFMPVILFYGKSLEGSTNAWRIVTQKGPNKMMGMKGNGEMVIRSVESAYRRYLREMGNVDRGNAVPRVMLVDETVDLEEIVARATEIKTPWLKMEAQVF